MKLNQNRLKKRQHPTYAIHERMATPTHSYISIAASSWKPSFDKPKNQDAQKATNSAVEVMARILNKFLPKWVKPWLHIAA